MSAGAVIAIAVGGTVLVAAAIVALVLWLRRSYDAKEQQSLTSLDEELTRRGWRYEENNDSYCSLYNQQNEFATQSLLQIFDPLSPYHLPPRAVSAKHIITGSHRGRPFLAATFVVDHKGERSPVRTIWVRTPGQGPALTVSRVARAQSRVRAGIGQRDLQSGNPDFDEQFEVSTGDGRFAQTVLTPQVTRFLLTDPRPFRSVMLLGANLDVGDPIDDHRDPAELIGALDLRCDLLDLVPRSAWA
ncbi:hypothetical protein [Amycolatopsis sp.]|jgi:hypothetical protein|uniref:hypothetical protein n=1 Tax=Amycolatopsis sp. TaxID=37632 RepID=UPI002DF851B3|nr:hypothetical protein [Amycolatopsis sp.]